MDTLAFGRDFYQLQMQRNPLNQSWHRSFLGNSRNDSRALMVSLKRIHPVTQRKQAHQWNYPKLVDHLVSLILRGNRNFCSKRLFQLDHSKSLRKRWFLSASIHSSLVVEPSKLGDWTPVVSFEDHVVEDFQRSIFSHISHQPFQAHTNAMLRQLKHGTVPLPEKLTLQEQPAPAFKNGFVQVLRAW